MSRSAASDDSKATPQNALQAMSQEPDARFILEDGTELKGYSFGAQVPVAGEVVFNTGMVGYPESLTDPSYRGQILVLSYPSIGNYGVPTDEKDEFGLLKHFESDKIQVTALIVVDYSFEHSHCLGVRSLGDWLSKNNVPAIYGMDTRALTKRIRVKGALLGKIVFNGGPDIAFNDPNKRNLVAEVSRPVPQEFKTGPLKIIAIDCGMKNNIIRRFLAIGVHLKVVPWNYDFTEEQYDGLFISNGPGDPSMVQETVANIRKVLQASANGKGATKPIFGICLGNQLLALAAGAKTYKMKFGNRSMNQPVIDCRTGLCYITPQNHGFAVDTKSLPDGWVEFFVNANDSSNEGIIHSFKPFFSVQFHPEATGGPDDTGFLFKMFLSRIRNPEQSLITTIKLKPNMPPIRKVLLLGSGGLSIGQAGEFDYSGSQCIKALKEENIFVVLINPNIATVQTSVGMADKVYFLPLTPDQVEKVLRKEKPDGILLQFGGQTALNCGVALEQSGILAELGVRVLGTPVETIMWTEDRKIFAEKLAEVGEKVAPSMTAHSIQETVDAARKLGYPVLVRAAYALGGLGSGFADDETALTELAKKSFAISDQVIVDKSVRGWKELEYEVVRDNQNNCITVCNMENFDPCGIHTGDSIVVAPSQTLTNSEYYKLRDTAIKVARHLGIVGECNIQYAVDPHSDNYTVIEVNARLSRSSALASKATGYPLAYVAAKLALGLSLTDIKNSVTKTTTACFEPAMDYMVVKFPRWDLKKFSRVSTAIGSAMKSVGEVMAIGRTFEETFQKALRMIDGSLDGFGDVRGTREEKMTTEQLEHELSNPTDRRVFAIAAALQRGFTVDRIHAITRIDRWFLSKLNNIALIERALKNLSLPQSIASANSPAGPVVSAPASTGSTGSTAPTASSSVPFGRGKAAAVSNDQPIESILSHLIVKHAKRAGFSDRQIGRCIGHSEDSVRSYRLSIGLRPFVKQIDTLAAEFPAYTNYLYTTYHGTEDDLSFDEKGVMVLGCGAYRIGSSCEFDWCAVHCTRTLRKLGLKSIVINCNPETVSTDYDECDRLYFEELSLERVLDIYSIEQSSGVIVSVGGQIPNNLAMPLFQRGVNILGTSPQQIDNAEDRSKFSALLDSIRVDQPEWKQLTTLDEANAFADKVGYPVLVRPSYVLSGAAMNVATNAQDLLNFLTLAAEVSSEHPVVLSKFILNAKEIELDAVAQDGQILNFAISEHIENAGVHSGDATLVLPAQKLYVETIRRIRRVGAKIAGLLKISGPFNIQFISKNNEIKVIECNLRASRSLPFVSKTFNVNFIELATKVMLHVPVKPSTINLFDLDYVCIKAPMFSFTRLTGADPTLGVEMASTGEVAFFGQDRYEAFLGALLSTGFRMPKKNILISLGSLAMKVEFLDFAISLVRMGFNLFASPGTYEHYHEKLPLTLLHKPLTKLQPNILDYLKDKKIELVINVPLSSDPTEMTDGYHIRRTAVDFNVPLLSNIKTAILFVMSLERVKSLPVKSWDEYMINSKIEV